MTPLTRWEDVTAEWVRDALVEAGFDVPKGSIARIDATPFGAGRGNLGGIARLSLCFAGDRPQDVPSSLVVKLAPAGVLSLVRSWRLGRRETAYYKSLGGAGPMRAPRCWGAASDDKTGDFTLLLEDLGAAEAGDQGRGATEKQAQVAIDQLARFHAHYWNSEDLAAHDWLHPPNANREAFEFFVGRAWKSCTTRYPDLPTSSTERLAALKARYGDCLDRMSSPPITLLHGDFRLDNMFFESDAWNEPFAVVDWQLVGRGRGPWDLGHFLAGSLTMEDRERWAPSLVRRYHGRIGDDRYALEDCLRDVDAGFVGSFSIAAVLVDMQVRSHGETHPVMEQWLRRSSAAASEALQRMT